MAKRWLVGAAALLVALLVASIVIALLDREEPLPEGTPEAAVQRFLKAYEDEDVETARDLLSEELKEECSVQEFALNLPWRDRLRDERVTLERTRVVEDTAFVTVRVTTFGGGGPFGASDYAYEQRFALRLEAGQWRFVEHPWPTFGCGAIKPERIIPPPDSEAPPTPEAAGSTPTPRPAETTPTPSPAP